MSYFARILSIFLFCFSFVLGGPASSGEGIASIDSVVIEMAAAVDSQHRPIGQSAEFPATAGVIHVTFRSIRPRHQFNQHRISFDIYSFEADRHVVTGGGVWFNHGTKYSAPIDTKGLNLREGKYRLDIRSGNVSTILTFDILGRAPRAIEIKPDGDPGLAWTADGSDWQELNSWSLPSTSPNIALSSLGGRILNVQEENNTNWSARTLIDGKGPVTDPTDFDRCIVCGWSDGRDAGTASVEIGFHDDRAAQIGAVVFDTQVFDWTRRGAFVANLPKYISIRVFDAERTVVYQADALLPQKVGKFLVPVPDDVAGNRIVVDVTETYGGRQPVLGEIEIRERVLDAQSIISDLDVDLARAGLGGALSQFTSFGQQQYPSYLFDDDAAGTSWASADAQFPQDFTIDLPNDGPAFVKAVRIVLPASQEASTWPSQIAVAVGDADPLSGLDEVARFAVPKRVGAHTFDINRDARFVKIRLLDNHGGPVTTLAQLSVIEGKRSDYVSALLRTPQVMRSNASVNAAAVPDLTEVEPNDTREQANPMQVGTLTRGRIDPLGEQDVFRLPENTTEAQTLSLLYEGIPNIRHTIAMQTCDGQTFSEFDPGKIPASKTHVTFLIQGEECFAALSEPEASIVLVWDTSGSMGGREQDLSRALRLYLERAPAQQNIALVAFGEDVITFPGGFSDNRGTLRSWALQRVKADGSTRFNDAMLRALDLLRDRPGNRGIIVLSDGFDTASSATTAAFWDRLAEDRVRIYTIGLGSGLNEYSARFATTGRQMLKQLSIATDGEAFFTTQSNELRSFYQRIADQLSRPAIYELTPFLESGAGELRLIATGEAVPGAAMPAVHVLMDVSGSMSERLPDGSPKISVAKSALDTILGELPDQTPFSFTAYGHRIPENPDKELACTDIETLHSLAPIDKQAVFRSVDALSTRGGTTPLTRGVAQIAESFGDQASEGIIIAITDGIEECDARPLQTIADLKAAGLEKIQVDVVGFNLRDNASREMMQKIAEIGGGNYYDASEGDALASAMRLAASARYVVRDSAGREVTRGLISGPPVKVPPGWYTVDIAAADRTFSQHQVRIDDGARTTMRVLKVAERFDIRTDPPRSLDDLTLQRNACGADALAHDGSTGQQVQRVQQKLNKLGFDVGAADGAAGPRTRAAVLAFQARYGIALDPDVSVGLEQHLDCVQTLGETYLEPLE